MDVEMKFTLPGILLMIFCFPLGILCAYNMRERKCRRCESPLSVSRPGSGVARCRADCDAGGRPLYA